jgi:hypothetical protein
VSVPELKAFYCQDTLTKVIYCDFIRMLTIKQLFKQTDQLLCTVCHALSEFCLISTRTEFSFGSSGSRLGIPIVTDYHCYKNPGFLIIPNWVSNFFFMFVPCRDLSIKINQDQLKNVIYILLFQSIFFITFLSFVIYSSP